MRSFVNGYSGTEAEAELTGRGEPLQVTTRSMELSETCGVLCFDLENTSSYSTLTWGSICGAEGSKEKVGPDAAASGSLLFCTAVTGTQQCDIMES